MGEQVAIYHEQDAVVALLKRYRSQLNVSQETMAKLCGVTKDTYARWERKEIKPRLLIVSVHALENCGTEGLTDDATTER